MASKKEWNRQDYKNNSEKYIKRARQWEKDNPERKKQLNKQWNKDHPKRVRETSRRAKMKYRYGLSYEDWLEMWESQDGKCAICGKIFITPSDAHIDHDHKTDELRGLLCKKCNFGISFFDDDPEPLAKAIKYLKKYRQERSE